MCSHSCRFFYSCLNSFFLPFSSTFNLNHWANYRQTFPDSTRTPTTSLWIFVTSKTTLLRRSRTTRNWSNSFKIESRTRKKLANWSKQLSLDSKRFKKTPTMMTYRNLIARQKSRSERRHPFERNGRTFIAKPKRVARNIKRSTASLWTIWIKRAIW